MAARPNSSRIQPNTQATGDSTSTNHHQPHTDERIHWHRVTEVVALLCAVALPLSVHASLFSKWFAPEVNATIEPEASLPTGAADIALLAALQNPNPLGARGGADLIVNEGALISTGPVGEDEIIEQGSRSGEIRVYTVREGDSLSEIAEMFDVTTNTILWANDLTKATAIKSGDTLVILPIAGVRHIVKSGDTISTIAKKYDGDVDEILSYNQLASANELSIGDTLIIPGGLIQASAVSRATPVRVGSVSSQADSSGFSHPAPGSVKTQGIHGYNAVDLAGNHGSTIRAAAAGEVIVAKSSGWNGGYGNYIVVKHANGAQTLYAHLSAVYVGVGATVAQAETIGAMGSTGKSTGTHLHFEVRGARNPF